MIVNKYGRVGGSIDLAALAQMYAQTDDDELRDHYRQVAAESGVDLDAPAEETVAEEPAAAAEPAEVEAPAEDEDDSDQLKSEYVALTGKEADGRWGLDRLRSEVEAAREG